MLRKILPAVITLCLLLTFTGKSGAEPGNGPGRGEMPCKPTYGAYCDKRPGGSYGARHPVNSPEEARALLERYYADQKGLTVGRIVERRWGFEAEVMDRNNEVIDRVMVHRRSGRIRSLF